jgi:hypothetical protein
MDSFWFAQANDMTESLQRAKDRISVVFSSSLTRGKQSIFYVASPVEASEFKCRLISSSTLRIRPSLHEHCDRLEEFLFPLIVRVFSQLVDHIGERRSAHNPRCVWVGCVFEQSWQKQRVVKNARVQGAPAGFGLNDMRARAKRKQSANVLNIAPLSRRYEVNKERVAQGIHLYYLAPN